MLVWMDAVVATVPVVASTDLVSSMTISNSDEDGFAFACNEDVFFFEYIDVVFCEDCYCAFVGCLAHTHQRIREVLECVCLP